MKKCIVLLVLSVFWSSQAFGLFGLFEDEVPPPEPVKKVKPVKPRICHYKIHVDGVDKDGDGFDDFKVWYVFKGLCGNITQVGIIDELQRKVFEINGNRIVLTTEYYGDNRKKALISETWGNLNTIHFFQKRVPVERDD